MPVEPRHASTLILMRPCRDITRGTIEVLMVLRHPSNKFAPAAYVFPGGALEADDCAASIEPCCCGLNRSHAARIIPDMTAPGQALGTWIAAVRECFEEVGMLPAYTPAGPPLALNDAAVAMRFKQYRQQLVDRTLTLEQILSRENLQLATDRIFYYAHWITPELSPIRYDVRFFITKAPEHQAPQHDDQELIDHLWITPQEALKANAGKGFSMVLPTIMTLRELAFFRTVDEVIASTRHKVVPPILTRLKARNKDYVEIMPDGTHFAPAPVMGRRLGN